MLQGGVLLWPKKPLFTMARWDLYTRGYLLQGQPQRYVAGVAGSWPESWNLQHQPTLLHHV